MGEGAVVLDASAQIAALRSEPGGERVAPLLDGGHLSTVNLSEVQAKLVEQGLPPDELPEATAGLGLVVHAFDEDMARRAAVLRLAGPVARPPWLPLILIKRNLEKVVCVHDASSRATARTKFRR